MLKASSITYMTPAGTEMVGSDVGSVRRAISLFCVDFDRCGEERMFCANCLCYCLMCSLFASFKPPMIGQKYAQEPWCLSYILF